MSFTVTNVITSVERVPTCGSSETPLGVARQPRRWLPQARVFPPQFSATPTPVRFRFRESPGRQCRFGPAYHAAYRRRRHAQPFSRRRHRVDVAVARTEHIRLPFTDLQIDKARDNADGVTAPLDVSDEHSIR